MSDVKTAALALMLTKSEAIYGVDSLPVPGSDAMLIRDLSFNAMVTSLYERQHVRPHFGNAGQLVVDYYSTADFSFEVCNGTGLGVRPAHSELMQMCALGEEIVEGATVKYKPINRALKSVTKYYYLDGLLHKMHGSRGSIELLFEVGKPMEAKVASKGLFGGQSDIDMSALPAANFSAWERGLPVNKRNVAVSRLAGIDVVVDKFSVKNNAKVEYINRPGREAIDCVGSASTGSITIETTRKSTKDWLDIVQGGIAVPIIYEHGYVAGNIRRFDAAKVYLTNPKYSEVKGISMTTFDLDFSTGLAGVQDDWVLTLK